MIRRYPGRWQVGRWNAVFGFERSHLHGAGWWRFSLGLFRLHTLPPQGEYVTRKFYRGFRFRVAFFLPIDVEQWR